MPAQLASAGRGHHPSSPSPRLPTRQARVRMRTHVHHALGYSACVLSNPPLRAISPVFPVPAPGGWGVAGKMRLSAAAAISHGRVFRRLGLGPESRIHLLRNLLTGLVRHERIEASWARVDEMRGYAEKVRGGALASTARVRPEGAGRGRAGPGGVGPPWAALPPSLNPSATLAEPTPRAPPKGRRLGLWG